MIAIEYHADLKEVQSDARLAALLSPDQQSAPFDRLGWWQELCQHCGLKPLIAVARAGDAIAVLPLQTGEAGLSGLANWYSFRLRPVISPGADGPVLLAALAMDLARHTHRIELDRLPDEDGSASALEHAFRSAGWIALRDACDANHVLEVNGRSYEQYLAGRPGQLRTTLKRKAPKVETEVLTRYDPLAWSEYEQIYRQSWKPAEGSPDFLKAFAEAEGPAGRLRLGIARANGAAIAAQMWTVERGTAFIHKLAHVEATKGLSPGSVLSAALFRHVIDHDRVALVDFGTGDDGYKRDWMETVRPRYRIEFLRPSSLSNWPIIAGQTLRRLARRLKHG